MKKHIFQFLFLALLLMACAPTGRTDEYPSPSNTATAPAPGNIEGSTPTFLKPLERGIINSASYTIIVKDPNLALTEIQKAVEDAGGFVTSGSSWSGSDSPAYSSLSAKIPPDSLPVFRETLNKIADRVQNQSFYVQDITSDYGKLQKRHQEIVQAQDQTWQMLTQSKDRRIDSTNRIVRELLDNELANVESQLESYEQQVKFASVDITINQPDQAIVPIE